MEKSYEEIIQDKKTSESEIVGKNLTYKKALMDQLKAFKDEESYFDIYRPYEFEFSDYLVRLFKFIPPAEFRPKTSLLMPSSIVGAEATTETIVYKDEVILPIAKIIKIGNQVSEKAKYKEGDLVFLPTNKILGYDWNPQFIHAHQFSQSNLALLTEMEQKLPRVEINYSIYQFTRLENLFADAEDRLTYLLPSSEVKGKYSL